MTEKTEKQEQRVEITEVVTQTERAFKLPDGNVVDTQSYLAWLGNLVYKLSKQFTS